MTRSAKKDAELEILRKVFPGKKYTVNERPDFILHGDEDFGVEIVEYYPDETIARLHNRPDYTNEITSNTYVHKDDADKLETVIVEYEDPKTGKWKKIPTPAVRQENMQITDRIALLIKLIDNKSKTLESYDTKLQVIDLVAQDSRNTLLDGINNSFVLKTLDNLRRVGRFSNSGFRSIYVILPPSKDIAQHIVQVK
ncbi:MAG: hypothetical protein U0524_00610 [Candidatus Saccharimonadales bacterium]